ncbi:MAG TPA: glycoside hydrolase family 38 C-terminal domain-containing protein [Gemmatimonadaceae bacterium]|nr:glycoside hydrolase family 38 C-terminal domain-containing protein [Gemmatimonadaceae bacterium]
MAERVDAYVVTHTHWDREWYHPAGRFRQWLVALLDGLLARRGEQGPVLLDGQTVPLDDYLSVRPEQRDALARGLRDGWLEAGPWYVLADELLPSGEALVRNLLAGRRTLRSLGAEPPPALYSPDAFGHPAALPAIAAGFGLPLVILWRGLGGDRWPTGDTMRWRAPDGTESLLLHLPRSGYEYASSLPAREEAAERWWANARRELGERSATGVVLLLNGADHHAPQHELDQALRALRRAAEPDLVHHTGLREVVRAIVARAPGVTLPVIAGELRDSAGYTWALQGTFATRAHQKRQAALVERLLVREAEPWTALAVRRGSPSRAALVNAAWRELLLCHPHDTYCGCSIDQVARAMSVRLEEAEAQARGLVDDALLALAGHDRVAARTAPDEWRNAVLVRNAAARSRGGIAELEVATLRKHVRVGPGSGVAAEREEASSVFSIEEGRIPYQILDRSTRHDRIESPEHYPHDDLVDVHRVVAWLPELPGYSVAALAVSASPAGAVAHAHPVATGRGRTIENEHLRVEVDQDGAVRLTSKRDGVVVTPLIRVEDVGDAGDLYTHSPIQPVLASSHSVEAELAHSGPLRAALRTHWRLEVAERSDRTGRSGRRPPLELVMTLTLDAGARTLKLDVHGTNTADDHRLRVVLATGIMGGVVHADAAFGPVHREPILASAGALRMETPPATAPLHRYVTLSDDARGVTVFSDGLAEYEATADGDVAITLVRAVGELSRNDLPERPGHAGWPAPTPDAQSRGPFQARLAILPHGPRTAAVIDAIERTADDVLLPLAGTPFRSALTLPSARPGIALEGEGLAFSACKESEDGEWLVLRCCNLLDRPARGRWRIGLPLREAVSARLDETPLAPLPLDGDAIELALPPRGIATVLAR